MDSYSSPLRTHLISDFVLQDKQKNFCKCYQNYLENLRLKFFIIQMNGRQHKYWGVFSDILAKASRLNTFHGLWTLYVPSSRHLRIIERNLRHIHHQCLIFTTLFSFGLWLVLMCIKTLNFHIKYLTASIKRPLE